MKKIITLFLAIGLLACNPNRVFNSSDSNFPNHRWYKEVEITFSVPIVDTLSNHQVYLALRHVHGFQFETMNVTLVSTSPSGKSSTKDYSIQVMGGDNTYLSDCSGDICDREVLIEDHVQFDEQGDWSFVIQNNMPIEYVPNVMEFGLIIDKYIGEK
ncbi:MAG: hypothetical protein JKY18_02340 [Flavobacteriales bacterium]|nr:hypothetical protein [Flavobacteriales bacterium]